MNSKEEKKELVIMAERILKKLCPFCGESDIYVDFIARKATCNVCKKSMGKEEGIKLLRRAEVEI